MEARKNLHGVTINACCASCQHVTINSHGNRKCLISKMPCAQHSLCSSYRMQDALKNLHIGGADGQVKKKEFEDANRSEYGKKPKEDGPYKRKHHKSVEMYEQQPIVFESEEQKWLEENSDFRPFGSEW